MEVPRIPPPTVARLPVYVQGLESMLRAGVRLTSSQKLAEATGIDAPQIRRDLSYLGAFGTPGVGYAVRDLLSEISGYLGLSHGWPVALMGYGRLGSALAAYPGFHEKNFQIMAIFDPDPAKVGRAAGNLQVLHPSRLPLVVTRLGIKIAVLATPAEVAQECAALLVEAGVTSLLNFAPTTLVVPPGVTVRNVDLAAEMQMLSFYETLKHGPGVASPRSGRCEGA